MHKKITITQTVACSRNLAVNLKLNPADAVSANEEMDDDNVYYRACILKQAQYDFGHTLDKAGQAFDDVTICNCTR